MSDLLGRPRLLADAVRDYSRTDGEVWYRVDDRDSSGLLGVTVYVESFGVLRHTPKGVWLNVWGRERFVLKGARKRWAYPTKAEAWESFRARKERQAEILAAQLERAETALEIAEHHNAGVRLGAAMDAASDTLGALPAALRRALTPEPTDD